MPVRQTRLAQFARTVLPPLHAALDGERILADVASVVATDRWCSFDRSHDTAQFLAHAYESVGARAAVHAVATGQAQGTGRWRIPEATDIQGGLVEVVEPVAYRLLDYAANPWHVAKWSSSTPRGGVDLDLVVIDTVDDLDRRRRGALTGKVVLTKLTLSGRGAKFLDRGATVVISDAQVGDLPDATMWQSWGWASPAHADGLARPVGLVLSAAAGADLRRLLQERGRVRLHVDVQVDRHTGSHDVVSGLVRGAGDPQDEVWVVAHDQEPGAVDNASGVACCVAAASAIEAAIAARHLPRPKRTIRFLNAFECYGFFAWLEDVRRQQPPLAGLCLDCVGLRPELVGRRLEWHDTIPMSAGFVNDLGARLVSAALHLENPGYRLFRRPFVSTSDTLLGDPQYGFPCPWLATWNSRGKRGYPAYHSSADTIDTLSGSGLVAAALATAAYCYHLADADSRDALELLRASTDRTLARLAAAPERHAAELAADQHAADAGRLRRFLWGGQPGELRGAFAAAEREVAAALAAVEPAPANRAPAARLVPRRGAPLSPTRLHLPEAVARPIRESKLPEWALFWADGRRDLGTITDRLRAELGREVSLDETLRYFAAHAETDYVNLAAPEAMVTAVRLRTDLRALGVPAGSDLMVHSSLSRIGVVAGGAETVVQALLDVVGPDGTVLFPSFNHGGAEVYNALTTPTRNGAIPDAAWRRADAVRSDHPTHAVAAIGPRAAWYTAGHTACGVWAQESPIGRLVHGGGWILSLGVGHETTTACHVAEMSVPCRCLDPFGQPQRVVGADGVVREVPGLAWRDGHCPVPVSRLEPELDARGVQRRGFVGAAESLLVPALALWELRREHLAEACGGCRVRPLVRPPGQAC